MQSNFAYRIVPAWWVDSTEQEFTAELELSGIDQKGLVNQVTRVISNNLNIDIKKINFRKNCSKHYHHARKQQRDTQKTQTTVVKNQRDRKVSRH